MHQPLSNLVVRPLARSDLPAALAIQAECYPAFLREDAAAFATRLSIAASYCLGAFRGDVLIAYLLAHGWAREAPPAVGTLLPPAAAQDVLFVHDLAVSGSGRGSGVGRDLVEQAVQQAAQDGICTAELIAVEGAAPFWRHLGFVEAATSPALAAKVARYGADARWMRREIGVG
jgi:GNAT superfamily N-acetyltransferase